MRNYLIVLAIAVTGITWAYGSTDSDVDRSVTALIKERHELIAEITQ